ncbi:MAG TPA: hypothetical protein VFZ59_03890 [Verrucomicrobiae bacterium]|nr:hypothetical protein [Verrucomicrobiae bacterium]
MIACLVWGLFSARAETVSIVIPSNAAPRVKFGAEKLAEALKAVKLDAVVSSATGASRPRILLQLPYRSDLGREGFRLALLKDNDIAVAAADDSGLLYGSLELARRIRAAGKLPNDLNFSDTPAMTLRGTCVGMQKTTILPGRKVYEYPYTPELFPWFYDKALWREYLDFLVANRMNTLYLWNGHPFASLVKLKDYPEAIEVPPDVFEKNVEMFHWLTSECDKRGIWLVQMFYNIFLPKPLAEKHGVSTQLAASTPLASDYTRKSIAEFVKQYPNVGLMVCLGEALQGTENQINWATNTILPGVLDGMRAAGLKEQPPVVIRTHAMNPEAIMPACFTVYSNLFTETKYNGESLTTYEPRGKAAETHRNMAKLGPHLVNVHILSNLEPFRYGATEFIRKSIIASRDRLHASGLHLYPLAYWNWPYSPDIANPPLKQWERDWIWFEAWARYAWNPDVPAAEDRAYWVGRLADFYGCDTNAAGNILDAYNAAGEVAPMLVRRFGITEGNRQTLSLGMTLDQLVNPKRYGAITELWESQAPPGERLDEYVRKEWNDEPHVGETPKQVTESCMIASDRANRAMRRAADSITKHKEEFLRLLNDVTCIGLLASSYICKVEAAEDVLNYQTSKDEKYLEYASTTLDHSLRRFRALTAMTTNSYHFANSMQTGHRKIPFPGAANGVGTNYHWMQVLPLYEKELADFKAHVEELKKPKPAGSETGAPIAAWPAAKFKLISTNAETYEVKLGARPFADRKYTLNELAPELNGLTGIRFSHEEAKNGRYVPVEFEVTEPVRVLIGYFQNERELWLQVPNLDFASHADERGGIDVILRNAAAIDECPNVNVHAFRYEPGRHKLELIGKGSFVVLGVVPQSVELKKRDARLGMK